MYRGSNIRAGFVIIIACLVIFSIAPEHVFGAAGETRYELVSGGITYGNDGIITGMDETLFHQQTLSAADLERAEMSFPGALPFSPGVDLAMPSISETVDQTETVTSTGFFNADLPFYPCCNFGAAPVGYGQFGNQSPVTPAGFAGNSLMYPEMINSGILTPNLTYSNRHLNSTMVSLPLGLATGALGTVASIANDTIGETPRSNMTPSVTTQPKLLSNLRYDFDANASEIDNANIVERLWRNSHLGHLMDVAYEGDSSNPAWMEPLKPTLGLQWRDLTKVINYSLNLTQPGNYLTKAFWDLEPLTPGSLEPIDGLPAGLGIGQTPVEMPNETASTASREYSGNNSSSNDALQNFLARNPA